jgi:hypothetical protein
MASGITPFTPLGDNRKLLPLFIDAALGGYALTAGGTIEEASLGDFSVGLRKRYPSLSDAYVLWAAFRGGNDALAACGFSRESM